jgi:hypothetical protein
VETTKQKGQKRGKTRGHENINIPTSIISFFQQHFLLKTLNIINLGLPWFSA